MAKKKAKKRAYTGRLSSGLRKRPWGGGPEEGTWTKGSWTPREAEHHPQGCRTTAASGDGPLAEEVQERAVFPPDAEGAAAGIRVVLVKVPSGEIALETGGDGIYLRFDCDCLDAIPYCKASCCNLLGTLVTEEEMKGIGETHTARHQNGDIIMARRSDGYCRKNCPSSHLCTIYEDRPSTCRQFHCSRGPDTRGWVLRLNRIEH